MIQPQLTTRERAPLAALALLVAGALTPARAAPEALTDTAHGPWGDVLSPGTHYTARAWQIADFDPACIKVSATPVFTKADAQGQRWMVFPGVIPSSAGMGGSCAGVRLPLVGFDLEADYAAGDPVLYNLWDGPEPAGTSGATGFFSEASPALYEDRIYLPNAAPSEGGLHPRGPLEVLELSTWERPSSFTPPDVAAGSSAGGLMLDVGSDPLFFLGTHNTQPRLLGNCNDHTTYNPDCGAIFSVDPDSATPIQAGLSVDVAATPDPFRAWVSAGLSSDGESVYGGGSLSFYIDSDFNGTGYGPFTGNCQAFKIPADIDDSGGTNALTPYDPGGDGCLQAPMIPRDDGVAGEVLVERDGELWVQWKNPSEESVSGSTYTYTTYVMHLASDLRSRCVAAFEMDWVDGTDPLEHRPSFGFGVAIDYQGPTQGGVDDRAYVMIHDGAETHIHQLEQPAALGACDGVAAPLYSAEGKGQHSPTLAMSEDGDPYILAAISSVDEASAALHVIDRFTGTPIVEIPLQSGAVAWSAPTVDLETGLIYVIQTDGTINQIDLTVSGSPIADYGEAHWPRYRRDNRGDACYDVSGAGCN